MVRYPISMTLVACLAVACGPADTSGPASGSGKADGVGTTHALAKEVVEAVTVEAPAVYEGNTTVAWYDDAEVTVQSAEVSFTHLNGQNIEVTLEADDHVSFVVEYRRLGDEQWSRLAVGPASKSLGGKLPDQTTELFRKLLLVAPGPLGAELWAQWVTPGWGWSEDAKSVGLHHVTQGDATEYRVFVTPDYDYRRWDYGESRSYKLSIDHTIRQRYLF